MIAMNSTTNGTHSMVRFKVLYHNSKHCIVSSKANSATSLPVINGHKD